MAKVEEISLPESIAEDYDAATPNNSLNGIKRLNAFVGPNNSGKSRLLRELFVTGSSLIVSTDDENARKVRAAVRIGEGLRQKLPSTNMHFGKLQEILDTPNLGFSQVGQNHLEFRELERKIQSLRQELHRIVSNERRNPEPTENAAYREAFDVLSTISDSLSRLHGGSRSHAQSAPKPEPAFKNAKFIYVPTLRGMRLGVSESGEQSEIKYAYFDRTWFDYVKGRKTTPSGSDESKSLQLARERMSGETIVTGLDFYDVLSDRLLGSLSERTLIRDYEAYLARSFFEGQTVTLIPRRDHDTVNIKVGRERERPIQSLGDGLQQVIILTLPLFEYRDCPLFLFIEEPDLFLHPGYQRAFIDLICADEDRELHVFVTTHSNQFLDITLSQDSCAIFHCRKLSAEDDQDEQDPRFSVVNSTLGNYELLQHLGVHPSSVMFANCTIWVEGITDRLYFSKFLELIFEERGLNFIENLHFVFVEYGGGNITHWSFLDEHEGIDVERVCSRLFLVADKDEGKDERHILLKEKLGNRFCRLNVREIENLLTPDTIREVIHEYEGPEIELNKFSQSDYEDQPLGTFIDENVLRQKESSKRYRPEGRQMCYADKSGTIKAKFEFCRRALRHIKSTTDLSEQARELAEKMCEFVQGQNRFVQPNSN